MSRIQFPNEKKTPCNLEAEINLLACILGNAMGDDSGIPETLTELRQAHPDIDAYFYDQMHQDIFRAVEKLVGAGKRVELLALDDELGNKPDVRAFVFGLTTKGLPPSMAGHFAEMLRPYHERRRAIERAAALDRAARSGDEAGMADAVATFQATREAAPFVILPSGDVTITQAANELFGLIAPSKKMFMRGGAVMTLAVRDDGLQALDVLRPAGARSFFENFARLLVHRVGANGESVLKPTICAEEMASALLHSEPAATLLPRVKGLSNAPVIRELEGQLSVAVPGFDDTTGLLITGGSLPPNIDPTDAAIMLLDLFAEFDFQTPGDRARAVASLISPALKMGGHLRGRVPADVAEADQSQSGKTYRQKLIAAIYNERVSLVTCRAGGVGSIDETLNAQLVAGRPFIQFDNFRGRFESAHLEAFLTAEGSFSCRVPYRGEITVAPENFFIFLTSNGVDTTRDLANRSNIIRIRKRKPGLRFKEYPEGDLLAHVRKNQSRYLGAIFAVIRRWYEAGKPRTNETRHDYREWVQITDWISQELFGTPPIMDGHLEAQERVSNPALVWLRAIILAAIEANQSNIELTATEIVELCEGANIQLPGHRGDVDPDRAKKIVGGIMAKLFKDGETIQIDGFTVTRSERYLSRETHRGMLKSKCYTIQKP